METKKIKATITQGKDRNLTLRVWLNIDDRQTFLVEKGKQPKGMIEVVIMDGKEDY